MWLSFSLLDGTKGNKIALLIKDVIKIFLHCTDY